MIDVMSVIAPAITQLSTFFTSLAQQERMKEGTEYSDNPDEAAQTDAEIQKTQVIIETEGSTVTLRIQTSGSLWDTVMESGQRAPVLGGSDGIVTMPDGSVKPSNVPEQLQGTQTISDFAEPPSVWKENFLTIARSLLPGLIQDIVNSMKTQIAEAFKPEILKQFQVT